jgi:hypothetical protein
MLALLVTFAIRLHVAANGEQPVVGDAWIAAQLAAANTHFAAAEIAFEIAGVDRLPPSAVHVETRADRNALARYCDRGGGVIDVFLVDVLDDVDVAGETRNGVAWRTKRDARKYVIVASKAKPFTLAHELGHVFGLPHSTYAVSIMNKTPRTEPPPEQRTFAPEEISIIEAHAAQLVRSKTLVPVSHPAE